MSPITSVLRLENVSKEYLMGDVKVNALKNVNLEIKEGEFLIIYGPSGSGKSTLLHMLGLLDSPTNGKVFIDGIDSQTLNKDKVARIRGEKIGFIFQFFNLHGDLTAQENVELPGMIIEKEDKQYALHLLNLVGLKNRKDHLPSQLSGGQRQRVAIARSLMNKPALILADEPTGNLDSKSGEKVIKMLHEINKKTKATMVIITHDPSLSKHARRVITIKDGEIVSDKKKRR